jgi:hypothetical protein
MKEMTRFRRFSADGKWLYVSYWLHILYSFIKVNQKSASSNLSSSHSILTLKTVLHLIPQPLLPAAAGQALKEKGSRAVG